MRFNEDLGKMIFKKLRRELRRIEEKERVLK